MSFLPYLGLPHDASMLPSRLAAPLLEGVPRTPVSMASSVAVPFRDLLLQQVMGALDSTAMTMDETGTGLGLSPMKWDELMALTHPGAQVPTPSIRQRPPRAASTALSIKQAPPSLRRAQEYQGGSVGHSSHQVTAKSTLRTVPTPEAATSLSRPIPAETPALPAHSAAGFLEKLGGVAQATAEALGLSPHLLLAQAALETGWGRKPLQDAQGQESYNLFGIKAGKGWTGKTIEVMTTEYLDGIPQKKVQRFRAYHSYAESFADYATLIKHRYGDAMANGATAEGFGRALQAKGYATDPSYALKIARVAQSVAYRLASRLA